MSQVTKNRTLPRFGSDAAAEDFVANADLTEYDLSGFRPLSEVLASSEGKRKTRTITFRLSEDLLALLKGEAKRQNIPYQRFMRLLLAKGLLH